MSKPDYLALLEARTNGSKVRTVKRSFCLVPELLDDRQLAVRAIEATRVGAGRYAGGPSEDAQQALEAINEQIIEASVTAVFTVPDPDTQAIYSRETQAASEEAFAALARKALTECYRSMLDPQGNTLEFPKEKFAQFAKVMWQGELLSAFQAIMAASTGEPDFPSSVRR